MSSFVSLSSIVVQAQQSMRRSRRLTLISFTISISDAMSTSTEVLPAISGMREYSSKPPSMHPTSPAWSTGVIYRPPHARCQWGECGAATMCGQWCRTKPRQRNHTIRKIIYLFKVAGTMLWLPVEIRNLRDSDTAHEVLFVQYPAAVEMYLPPDFATLALDFW